ADRLDLALLQDAQELVLDLGRDVADLVEEEGAAVGFAEEAAPGPGRAGEGAALVAEELALEERRRQRRAVEGDEGRLAPERHAVDRAREELLAGAALAEDEHARVRRRDASDERQELLHRRRLADDLGHAADALDLVAEAPHLA